jgi:hypothetical protein|tara:strand:+ start:57 stop:401 length:345 start_codon:yes stop_codon:yes gene_type:complete
MSKKKTDLEVFQEIVQDLTELVFGTPITEPMVKPKRARTKGRYKADDKSTADVNEAWVGGKAPIKSPFPTPEPSMKWTRKQINDYCNEFGVLHKKYASKKELLNNIKETYPNGI